MSNKTIYVVQAYRWGKRENHSYVVGVFDTEEQAIYAADNEEESRGIKYKCAVITTILNEFENIDSFKINWREIN